MKNIDIFNKLKALGIKDISQLEKGNIQYWWNEKYKQIIASNTKVKTNPFSDEILKINLFKEELQALEIEDLKSILKEGKYNKDWQKKISLNQETIFRNETQNLSSKNFEEFRKSNYDDLNNKTIKEGSPYIDTDKKLSWNGFLFFIGILTIGLTISLNHRNITNRNPSDNIRLEKKVQNSKIRSKNYGNDKYIGQLKDDKKHGQGTFNYSNGDKYFGEFRDDKRHGQGTFTRSNGDKYVGQWKDNIPHGQGTFTYSDGDKYVGEFRDGKYERGTYTFANRDKYVGQWKDNIPHGQGTYTWLDGKKYYGDWINGKRHGQGTYTWSNGDKYFGQVKDNLMHGYGTYTWSEGDKYVGFWSNDKRHGSGTYTWSNGKKYVGQWVNGRRQ